MKHPDEDRILNICIETICRTAHKKFMKNSDLYSFKTKRNYRSYNKPNTSKKKELNKKRTSITVAIKKEVWKRDGGKCRMPGCNGGPIEYDHIIPVSKGGTSEANNIQLLCHEHNRKKHTNIW